MIYKEKNPNSPIAWESRRCFRCGSREYPETVTPAQAKYLQCPPGVDICLGCAIKVPENVVVTQEELATLIAVQDQIAVRKTDFELVEKDEADWTRTFGNF